jgi:hypothetical protein
MQQVFSNNGGGVIECGRGRRIFVFVLCKKLEVWTDTLSYGIHIGIDLFASGFVLTC